jgi:hypothetical protein
MLSRNRSSSMSVSPGLLATGTDAAGYARLTFNDKSIVGSTTGSDSANYAFARSNSSLIALIIASFSSAAF